MLPANHVATVYLNFKTSPCSADNWVYYGFLGSEKASVIFKILPQSKETELTTVNVPLDTFYNLQVGISIENAAVTETLKPAVDAQKVASNVNLVRKIVQNFYNFVSSFVGGGISAETSFFLSKLMNEWLTKVGSKIELDPEYFVTNTNSS